MKINILNESQIRIIVFNELKKSDKIVSIEQMKALIKIEVNKNFDKIIYKELDKLRKRINKIEVRIKI